jgi:hypothetical protein
MFSQNIKKEKSIKTTRILEINIFLVLFRCEKIGAPQRGFPTVSDFLGLCEQNLGLAFCDARFSPKSPPDFSEQIWESHSARPDFLGQKAPLPLGGRAKFFPKKIRKKKNGRSSSHLSIQGNQSNKNVSRFPHQTKPLQRGPFFQLPKEKFKDPLKGT